MTDFVAMVMDAQNGAVATDINLKLQELVTAIRETQEKGVLLIKVTMRPGKFTFKGAREKTVETILADFDCSMKKPELGQGEAVFYVDDDGQLTRTDPRQEEMFAERKEEKNV